MPPIPPKLLQHQQVETRQLRPMQRCRLPALPLLQGRGAAICALCAIASISAQPLVSITSTFVTTTAGANLLMSLWPRLHNAGFSKQVISLYNRQFATGGLSGLSILDADDFSLNGLEHCVSIPEKTDTLARGPEFSKVNAFGDFLEGEFFLEIVLKNIDDAPRFDNSTQFGFDADLDDDV